jgi:hypothetical protein
MSTNHRLTVEELTKNRQQLDLPMTSGRNKNGIVGSTVLQTNTDQRALDVELNMRTHQKSFRPLAMPLGVFFGLALAIGHGQSVPAATTPTYTITLTTSVPSATCNGLNISCQTTPQVNGTSGYFAMVNTDGVLTNLGSPNGSQGSVGQVLTAATGIDNNGRISGVGSKNGGTGACHLMTPK